VTKALLSDRFELEEFPALSQLLAVERWAQDHPSELLPHGKAMQRLLRQSIMDVIARIGEADDMQLAMVVDYLRVRYVEGGSVNAIAEAWGCSRVHVWRKAGKIAMDFVTERFLELARDATRNSEIENVLVEVGALERIPRN
jgi:hypothetical protein